MDVDDTLSERVADTIRARLAYRRRRNATPSSGKELAALVGMSQSGMSARLTGATPIDLNDLERIAAALDVEIAELLPTPARRSDRHGGESNPDSPHMVPRPRPATTGTTCVPPSVPPPPEMPAPAERGPGRRIRRPVVSYTHVTDGVR